MHRIDSATALADANGAGKDGFTGGTPPTVPPTALTAKFFNAIQEEMAQVVEDDGLTLSDADHGQLLSVLNRTIKGFTSVASAAGTTVLTAASNAIQIVTGVTTQTIQLPSEMTIAVGRCFRILNFSTGVVTVKDSASNTLFTIPAPIGTNRVECAVVCSTSAGAATGNWVYFYDVPGQRHGTITNDSAAAGNVGEEIISIITPGAPIGTFTDQIAKDITSILLTPGDWDVSGCVHWIKGGVTSLSAGGGIHTISNTMPGEYGLRAFEVLGDIYSESGMSVVIPPYRVSVAANTTYYLVGVIDITAGTPTACGHIRARRIR